MFYLEIPNDATGSAIVLVSCHLRYRIVSTWRQKPYSWSATESVGQEPCCRNKLEARHSTAAVSMSEVTTKTCFRRLLVDYMVNPAHMLLPVLCGVRVARVMRGSDTCLMRKSRASARLVLGMEFLSGFVQRRSTCLNQAGTGGLCRGALPPTDGISICRCCAFSGACRNKTISDCLK